MTFQEQSAELNRIEAVAKRLGLSEAAFERIAVDVTGEAHRAKPRWTAAQSLAEIRRRIYEPAYEKARNAVTATGLR